MIFTDRKITIRNGKSSINEPVILYRGDYEVSIKFTIMESKFRFKSGVNLVDSEKASHGQLAILAPYGGNVFSEIVKCEDGTVTFTLTKEMIDQLEEVGLYSFQIRLFDYYRESRVSIPPVEFGIEVREPVASEDHDNEVNNAIVGYSIAKVVDGLNEDIPDTFDANGQYNKTDWETGDRISEGKLNKIEEAIDKINQNEINGTNVLNKQMVSNFNILQSHIEVERQRIDQIASLEEGSTTGDAELIDARFGYNGEIFDSLGGSIRTQFTRIDDKFDDLYPINLEITTIDDGYITKNGDILSYHDTNYTDYIEVEELTTIRVVNANVRGSRAICAYNGDKIFVACLITNSNDTTFTLDIPKNVAYLRASCHKDKPIAMNYMNAINKRLDELKDDIVNKAGLHIEEITDIVRTNGKYILCSQKNDHVGYTIDSILVSDGGSMYTEIANIKNVSNYMNNTLTLKLKKPSQGVSTSTRGFGFCDNKGVISYINTYKNYDREDAAFLYYDLKVIDTHFFISEAGSYSYTIYAEKDLLQDRLGLDDIKHDIIYNAGLIHVDIPIEFVSSGKYISCGNGVDYIGYNITSLFMGSSDSSYTDISDLIDVSNCMGQKLIIRLNKINVSTSTRGFGFCDSTGVISFVQNFQTYTREDDDYYYYEITVNNTHFFISYRNDYRISAYVDVDTIKNRLDVDSNLSIIAYVSPSGHDSNNGALGAPFKTVNKALESGATEVRLFGGLYKQTINLSKCKHKRIDIVKHESTKNVTFIPEDCVLCDTETLVSGKTKVYKATIINTPHANNPWIFQDGIADVSTLISDEERHPAQRGYECRCEDTKIVKCKATNAQDAIAEIENDSGYKWFIDGNILYFSRPSTVSTTNPICVARGGNLFSNVKDTMLRVTGINVKYMTFNVNGTHDSVISDCKCSNIFGYGAFVYDSALNCTFIRCEASRCTNGVNGDGFNGHCSSSGDIYSKQSTVALIECWSHDNMDDGYSDHERAEIFIIGGLYEYNGKGGIVPSYGSHCSCHNVLSRQNHNGFYYTGTATDAEGGKYGQLICYNCVAENNIRGGDKAGFIVDGDGNSMKLINCKSIGNNIGYKPRSSNNSMELIDCTSYQDTIIKDGYGTFIIKNTTIVE